MSVMRIEISKIRRDGGTQSRAEVNQNTVDEYAGAMKNGDSFPPVKLFYDGESYWLADGFHRVAATLQFGSSFIEANVIQGTQRAAILSSVGANAKHGLRRSRDDMRRAIHTLLKDGEWSKWSDREISKMVGCDHKTVGSERTKLSGEIPQMETRTVERNGTIYEMKPAASTVKTESSTIINSAGVSFHLGDCIRVASTREADRFGVITKIEGDEAVIGSVICRPRPGTPIEEMRVSRLHLFAATDNQFLYWYRSIRLSKYDIALFPYEDHFLAFNSSPTNFGTVLAGFNWHPNEKWDTGVAWRIHRSYLEYWRSEGKSVGLATYDYGAQIEARLRPLVIRAGKSRGGEMNRPPQPEAVQPVVSAPSAPEKPVLPEWAYEGNTVQHMSGKQCLIERKYFTDRWMLRVEMIKPADGFADASVFEFGPLPNPTILQPMPDTTQKPIQVGDTVITRTGRTGEVIDANGLIKVQTASYTSNHDPSSLKIAPAPAATATPIFNDSQMKKLQTSLERMFTFLELGLIPDEGNLLNDLENIYQAQHTARSEYRKLLDPRTGELIGEKR